MSKKENNKTRKILYLIQQSGVLMQMPRTHVKHFGNSFDNVASHSYQTAVIAYCLARMEKLSQEDALKCVGMAIFHDLSEARTGDLDFIAKHYATVDEDKAVDEQLAGTGFDEDIKKLLSEYSARESLIAKCARDADSLAQFHVEWVLMWQGNDLAKKWFDSDFNDRIPGLKTDSARTLAFAMRDSNPHEWWWSQFLEDDAVIDTEKLLGKE